MNSTAIKLLEDNPSSILVYAEGRANRKQILERFTTYLIKSDLWFHILKVSLPKIPRTPNNIGGGLKDFQRQIWKESLFVIRTKMSAFFRLPSQSNTSLKEKKVPCSLIATIIK